MCNWGNIYIKFIVIVPLINVILIIEINHKFFWQLDKVIVSCDGCFSFCKFASISLTIMPQWDGLFVRNC